MAGLGDDVRALLDAPNFGHLATVLPSGAPHVVPVWVGVEGDRVAFFTQPGSRKAQNLARDPRVALSLTDFEHPYRAFGSEAASPRRSPAGRRSRSSIGSRSSTPAARFRCERASST